MTKEQIKVSAGAFCKKFSITSGWSQEQHVGFVFGVIMEEVGIEGKEERDALLQILSLTCNPSAFRQTLESAEILEKSAKGERSSVLANKYAV